MGTSNWQNISYCIGIIKKINPQKVLDIGIGFGKWGFLTREYLDVWGERVHSRDWKIQIDGVEIFEKNIEEHQRSVYTNIYLDDALNFISTTNNKYDLIIIGDVLEHFEKQDALKFLDLCYGNANYIMLNIPIGKYWKQKAMYNNEFEEHKSFWSFSEFKKYNIIKKKKFRDSQLRLFMVLVISRTRNKVEAQQSFYLNFRALIYQYPNVFNFLRKIKNIMKN